MRSVRFALVGLGNLGARFCEMLQDKRAQLGERYGLDLCLVAAADSRGAAYSPAGLDLAQVLALKRAGDSIANYPAFGRVGWGAVDLIAEVEADLLLEASPVNLDRNGEPGLSAVRTALQRGMHVVTPNKGPMVLAYQELHQLAADNGVELRFDGTVAGGLPAINLGQRDLRGAEIRLIEAVPNLVTGYVMDQLAAGLEWDTVLDQARDEGVLEADSSWDLDGWDAAAKLVILVNAVLGLPATLSDVARTGISGVQLSDLKAAKQKGGGYRLLARAEQQEDESYALSVEPSFLSEEHPLGRLGSKGMGVLYETDIYGTLTAIIHEPNPMPSATTMLRDLLDIYL